MTNPDPLKVKKDKPVVIEGKDGARATLSKVGNAWCLLWQGRGRWGNVYEIRDDIAHFETYGTLPHSKKPNWS